MKPGDLVYLVGKKGGNPWRYAMGIVQNPSEWGGVRVLILQHEEEGSRVGDSALYLTSSLELVYEDQLAAACGAVRLVV